MDKKRIVWIDYLKAFACFLVVLGHLLQSFQKANIDNYTNITNFINWFIYLFHMPLFIMISGFLYCKREKINTFCEYKKFVIKKIVNLMVPYVAFYLIFVGINMLFSNSVNTSLGIDNLIGIINNPIAPYWYLYAITSIFIFIPILEKICNYNKKIVFSILIILKILSFFMNIKLYFIDSIIEFGIYFYLGKFISMENINKSNLYSLVCIMLYIIIALLYYFIANDVNNCLNEFIRLLLSLGGIYVFVQSFKNVQKSKILDTFKNYTFQIYLMHTIFAAGIRIILLKLGIDNYFIHLIFGLFFSIYIPIFISKISNKIEYTNFFFYPIKTIEELKGRKTK